MLRLLNVGDQIHYTTISKYELDKNEPPLGILLAYARSAQVHLEEIVDDDVDLPPKLPGTFDYHAAMRKRQKTAG